MRVVEYLILEEQWFLMPLASSLSSSSDVVRVNSR
jgi:hypothetical protein